jgi:peptidoglycan-N-acetylglucosamine deacetylase
MPLFSPGVGMRILAICLCALVASFARLPVAQAEQVCSESVLGVSRVAEVDTSGGPWFGEPHGNRDFLAPGEVVLTFDDGPAPRSTRAILAALSAQCTKATFFVLGEKVVEFPDVVGEIAAQGHTIGTHTWSHKNIKRLSDEQAKAQIEATFAAAQKAAGQPIAPFFRYPYLSDSASAVAYLQSRNIGQFAIDIDSFDWRSRNAKAVIHRVMAALERRGRGIILFHDIHTSTAQAMPELLALLKAKGFKVVHLRPKFAAETLAGYQPPVPEAKIRVARRHSIVRVKAGGRVSGWPGW